MDLPLITRVIKGKAVARGAEYGSRLKSGEGSEVGGDETEDLYRLLVAVKVSYVHTYQCWCPTHLLAPRGGQMLRCLGILTFSADYRMLTPSVQLLPPEPSYHPISVFV
jgi:hypothetical protein